MADTFATKEDLHRVEVKVESLAVNMAALSTVITELSRQISVRDAVEKQAQILKAEIEEGQRELKLEREKNAEAWTALKTRALWIAMTFLLVIGSPNIVNVWRQVKGLIPP